MGNLCAQYKIISVFDRNAWDRYLDLIPAESSEIYFSSRYYALYESEFAKAECFVYENEGKVVLYPYLKTNISHLTKLKLNGNYYDIEGAYGYNGMISNSKEKAFLDEFAAAFTEFCVNNNIVAEFTRFNPLLKNHLVSRHLKIEVANQNVILDLTPELSRIWMHSYEHSTRKNIKKAQHSGLDVKIMNGLEIDSRWLEEFIRIYYLTMDRNNTNKFYYFNKEFFHNLIRSLGRDSVFFFTILEGRPVSCELVLLSNKNAYSFLGGTLKEHYTLRPNNLLKHHIINHLKETGRINYCIGGGVKPDDGIFRYKKTFAKHGVTDFYIGKRIYNEAIYNAICDYWEKCNPQKARHYKGYLLKYKY